MRIYQDPKDAVGNGYGEYDGVTSAYPSKEAAQLAAIFAIKTTKYPVAHVIKAGCKYYVAYART